MEKMIEGGSTVRIFYALVTVLVSLGVAFFVYQNAVNLDTKYPFKLGLDLSGGSHLVYEADTSGVDPTEVEELMDVLRLVIEKRVNIFGVSEPIVQVESSSAVAGDEKQRLVVELPGVTDVSQAIEEIGRTPLLEFKLVDEQMLAAEEALAEINAEGSDIKIKEIEPYTDTGLTGRYLESAQLQFVGQNNSGGLSNEAVVAITWNKEGAELFEQITAANIGKPLAIFLDGELISSPNINERISGGQAVISGGFTPDEARELAQNLSFGALPLPISLQSTQTIGASLGSDILDKGIKAGLIGFGLVMLFMVLWYRLPGLVAVLALLTYVAGMLALFQLIPVVLTAAGLAGFILTIGMAVDANVLVFERMKEELREGKSMREAAQTGFARAWSAIRDGNVTSLLSAIVLFWFGTSMVKGFALVFGIGVLVSMLSAILVTRTLLLALPDKKITEGLLGKLYDSGLGK